MNITIQTPDGATANKARKLMNKKPVADTSGVGEKSVFSVTPFLNRNSSRRESMDETILAAEELLNESMMDHQQVDEEPRQVTASA